MLRGQAWSAQYVDKSEVNRGIVYMGGGVTAGLGYCAYVALPV